MAKDIDFLLAPGWRESSTSTLTPAVHSYLDHLSRVVEQSPILLLAHIYTQVHLLLLGFCTIPPFEKAATTSGQSKNVRR